MRKLKFSKNNLEKEFFETLKTRVNVALGDNSISSSPDISFYLKALFWFSICWGSYYILLFHSSLSFFFLWYLTVQLSGLLFGFSVGHDAAHKIISKNKYLNQTLHYISFITVGIDPLLWGLRHVRSHHLYPNIEGSDIDIDKNPLLRLSFTHPWNRIHAYQHIYAPFAYFLALLHSVFWGDWVYLIHKDYEWMRRGVNPVRLWLSFLSFKIIHFTLMIMIPVYMLPVEFNKIIFWYVVGGGLTSLIFILMLVGTHFFDEADYLSAPFDRKLEHSWAVHNLRTSCDWNPGSSFSRFISGGANCHAAHHLFPNICHVHYKRITPIIEQTAREFEIPYYSMTLSEMVRSHFRHLKKLGKN